MAKEEDKKFSEENDFPTVSLPGTGSGGTFQTTQIGPYKLVRTLGEGGFGYVFLAEQEKPIKRQVALKVIKPGMDTKRVIARFEAERQALALLNHPHIAKVFDAGSTDEGRPFFVMEYVEGIPITDYCDQKKLSIKKRLELFIKVCEAIHHAHQKGIIHRDIKPSNVLVSEENGHAVPKVIDFGIAKAISQHLTEETIFTEQGQLVGTPEYMSPEQADLGNQDIDTLTDVYSLGVLLYELLTGTLPFDPQTLRKAAFREIQRIICEQEPPRPSTRISLKGEESKTIAENRQTAIRNLQKQLHNELEWIPLMAMRKERNRRYQSASDFGEDLKNYLDGNPLIAGPESGAYRIKKYIRKNRVLVTSVALIVLVLIIGIIASTFFAIQAKKQEQIAEQNKNAAEVAQANETIQRRLAEEKAEELSQQLYCNLIQSAQVEIDKFDTQRAYDLLQKCPEHQRGWEWYYLLGKLDDSKDTIFTDTYNSPVNSLSICKKGKYLAFQSPEFFPQLSSSQLYFWDLSTKEIFYNHNIMSTAMERSGFYIGSDIFTYTSGEPDAHMNLTLPIMDIETQEPIVSLPVGNHLRRGFSPGRGYLSIAISPDDTLLAISKYIGEIQIWNINTCQVIQKYTLEDENKMSVAKMEFSPDGSMLAITSHGEIRPNSDILQIIELENGTKTWEYNPPSRGMNPSLMLSFAFSPDSKILAISDVGSSKVDLIDLNENAKIKELYVNSEAVTSLAFSPDGRTIAIGSEDNTIRLWDKEAAREERVLVGHASAVTALIFNKNPEELISAGSDGKIKFWDWKPVPISNPNKDIQDDILIPNYQDAKNKRYISVEDQNAQINVWNTETQNDEEFLSFSCMEPIQLLSYSPDGKYIAAANNREIVLFNTLTKQSKTIYVNKEKNISSLEKISSIKISNTNLLAEFEGDIKIWDFNGNNIEIKFPIDGIWNGTSAISNDGTKIAFCEYRLIKIWDVKSNSVIHTIEEELPPKSMLFDMNSENLVCLGFGSDEVQIYDLETGKSTLLIDDEEINCDFTLGGFTVDNNLVIIKNYWPRNMELVQVWDIHTGKLMSSTGSINHDRNSEKIQYGGQYIAKPVSANKIKIIDLNNKQDICSVDGHWPVEFSPNGNHVAVTDGNRVEMTTIEKDSKLYSIDDIGKISFCSLFNDNNSILAITDDNILSVWQVENGKEIYSIEYDDAIKNVAIDPDQKYLVAILNNGLVVVRNHDNLAKVSSFQTNQKGITTISFSPDSTRIVTGGLDETLKIWDVKSGMELLTVSRDFNTKKIYSSLSDENAKLAFTKDGRSIIHRSGNRIDLKKINEMNFKSLPLGAKNIRKDFDFERKLFQSRGIGIEQLKPMIQSLPNGVNTKLHRGQSLLSFYVKMERFDVARYLLDEGAELPRAEVFYDLCGSGAIQRELSSESILKQEEFIDYLLNNGFQINGKTPFGYTPLHIAILQNQLDTAEFLIKKGVDVNTQDGWSRTPLTLYLMRSNDNSMKSDFIKFLIESGANINTKSNKGYTPLHYATIKGFEDITKMLLEHGAMPNIPDSEGDLSINLSRESEVVQLLASYSLRDAVPVHLAIIKRNSDALKELLNEDKSLLNIKNNKGETPLYLAVCTGYRDAVEFLRQYDAVTDVKIIDAIIDLNQINVESIINQNPEVLSNRYLYSQTLLHLAVRLDSIQIAETLLNKGIDVNLLDDKGYTALDYASSEQKEIAQILKEHGGKRAVSIHKTALLGDLKTIKSLLNENQELINSKDIEGMTPLQWAAIMGHKDVAEYLILNGATINNAQQFAREIEEKYGHVEVSRLLYKYSDMSSLGEFEKAILIEDIESMKKIIEQNPDVIKGRNVSSAILSVVRSGRIEIAELLLSNGVDANARLVGTIYDSYNISPLFACVAYGHTDLAELLIKYNGGFDAENRLNQAGTSAHLENASSLISEVGNDNKLKIENALPQGSALARREFDWRYKTTKGLLFYAVQKNKIKSVEAIVEYGLNPNVNFIDECYLLPPSTPLHWAVRNGNKEIIEYLINNGADVNGKFNRTIYPPLSWATIYNQPQIALFLIKKGAGVNAKDIYLNGATPLYLAAKNRNLQVARILIANGAEVSTQTRNGASSLHQAAQNGDEAMVQLLIENGADVNIKNKENQTPLHMATLMGHKEIIEMLLKNGADINAEFTWQRRQSVLGNNRQWTVKNFSLSPLDIAAQWNYPSIAQLLIDNGATRHFAMQRATERENVSMLKLLVESDPNNKSDINECLLLAIRANKANMVSCLVDLGAEINIKGTSPEQPKFYMNEIKPGYVEVSARPGSGDRVLETPLHLAAELGYLEIVKCLVEKGANPNVLNFLHKTPLDVAIINDHTEIADFLKDRTELPMPRLIGDFGTKERLVFQGNEIFSKDQICKQLFMDTDIIASLSPTASFAHYLNTLQEKIISGYKNNGFYEPQVNVSFDNEQQKILVEINEGQRYKKGQIIITGINDSLKTQLIQRLKTQDLLEIYPDVSDMVMNMLKGSFKFPFTWDETDWASFDESFIEPAKQYVDQLLNMIGYYNAEFDLKVVPVQENHTAELRIIFTKEGTFAKIGTIDISGNTINTDEQIITFLGLEKELSLNSLLTNSVQNKLGECGRFRQHTVNYDIDENDPANSTLKIVLQEIPGATPLCVNLKEQEQLLKKVGEFFADYENWEEELCFTLSMDNKLPYTLEGVISSKYGFVLTETDDGAIINSLALDPKKVQYICPLLGHYMLFDKPKTDLMLQFTLSPDENESEEGWSMMLGGGISGGDKNHVQNELGYDLQMNIPPAFWMSEANKRDTTITYIDNTAVIELRGDGNSLTVIKADRETGKIIELNRKEEKGSIVIRFQKGAFEREKERVQKEINSLGLKPTQAKSAIETILRAAVPLYLTHFPNNTLSTEQKRTSLEAWNHILSSDISTCFPREVQMDTDDGFSLPHYDLMSSMNNMISLFSGAAFGWCHENLPQDHWLRILAHIFVLGTSGCGQDETISQETKLLYTSDQIGPVGYYLIAKVFKQMGQPIHSHFAQRARQSLTPDEFRKDWEPLVSGDFKLAKNIRCTFDKLRDCESQDIHSVASILPAKVGVNFETIINRLKGSKEMTPTEVLDDLVANEWPSIKEMSQSYLSEKATSSEDNSKTLIVGSEIIKINDVILPLEQLLISFVKDNSFEHYNQLSRPYIVGKIQDEIIYRQGKQELDDSFYQALNDKIEERVNKFKEKYGNNEIEIDKALKQVGINDIQEFREYLKKLIIGEAYISKLAGTSEPMSVSQMQKYYESHLRSKLAQFPGIEDFSDVCVKESYFRFTAKNLP